MTSLDVVVIGAGAAGLLAASRCAEQGCHTVLLEKNPRAGVKILMSGGTRCNLTQATDARGIVRAFGEQGRFLRSALAAFGPDDLVSLVEQEGVPTKTESTGKVFPQSDKAADILKVFLNRLERAGARLELSCCVSGLTQAPAGWQIQTERGPVTAHQVVVATGGRSYPGCGTTGDGWHWLKELGHTIIPVRPALVPVSSDAAWVQGLAGVTIADVQVSVVDRTSPEGPPVVVDSRPPVDRGSLLFTHRGVSGPVVLNVSRGVTAQAAPGSVALRCDFLPTTAAEDVERQIQERCTRLGRKSIATLFDDLLPRRLVEALLGLAGVAVDLRAADLSRAARRTIVTAIKQCLIPVTGTLGYAKAEVSAGGVALDEVDSRTCESRIAPGLYLVGEILDLDGPIGGYNFQAAFSTAWLAAEQIGRRPWASPEKPTCSA